MQQTDLLEASDTKLGKTLKIFQIKSLAKNSQMSSQKVRN